MRAAITACTERIFLKEPMPLAHLRFGMIRAVNDNEPPCADRPAIWHGQPQCVPTSHAAQERLTSPSLSP